MTRVVRASITTLALAMSGQLAVAQEGDVPRYEPLDQCFLEMPEEVAFDCGTVIVPEFHDRRSDSTISLGIIRLQSSSDSPKEPIFFGTGGPGGSGFTLLEVSALSDHDGYYSQLLANHDLIFFSQRGTAYSDPFLPCYGVNDISDNYLAGSYGQWSDVEREKIDRLKACYDETVAVGLDLSAFNSVENASDVNSLRELLGYESMIYYGESYGTLLGQHIMRMYPETLTAVVLDGALSIAYPTWETELDARYEYALGYLVDLCSAQASCSETYPNLETDIKAVYRQLQETPYEYEVEGVTFAIDEQQFSMALYNALYDTTQLRFIPYIVDTILEDIPNDTAPGFFVAPLPSQSETGLALLMHFAVVCSEDPVVSTDQAFSLENLRFELVTDYVNFDSTEYVEMCAYMGLPILPDETDAPISSEVPVLILNGRFDPVTPEFTAAPIGETLANAYSVTFPFGDHVQGALDECAHAIMLDFFADSSTRPDSGCTGEVEAFDFFIPEGE